MNKPKIGIHGYISGFVALSYLTTLLVCAFLIDWHDFEYRYDSFQNTASQCPPVLPEEEAKAFGLPILELGR